MLFQLKKGEVGPLVPVPAGYHIVKVVERDYAGQRPLDEKTQTLIREILFDKIVQQEIRRLVDDLWRRARYRSSTCREMEREKPFYHRGHRAEKGRGRREIVLNSLFLSLPFSALCPLCPLCPLW